MSHDTPHAGVTSLSPEATRLLGAMQSEARERLAGALESALAKTDDYLFDLSRHDPDTRHMLALRDIRRARSGMARGHDGALESAFQLLIEDPTYAKRETVALSLLSNSDLEEQLALEQVVDAIQRAYQQSLHMIERRFAMLLRQPDFHADRIPVGPKSLGVAARYCLSGVELEPDVKVVFYKFYEREMTRALGPLYDRINADFAGAGVLPGLRPAGAPVREPAPSREGDGAARGGRMESSSHVAEGGAPSYHGGHGVNAGPSDAADGQLFSSLVDLLRGWRSAGAPGAEPQGPHVDPHRPASGHGAIPHRPMSPREMISVLSLLQTEPPPALGRVIGNPDLSLAQLLKRELLDGARRFGVGDDDVGMAAADEDAIDLVGMLFDVLLDERHFEPAAREMLGKLVVPFVKVAVIDRRMFLHKQHPARRLLNAVAEACEGNRGDGPQERELLDRARGVTDRLIVEFNEDLSIFETLESELRSFLDQNRKRIELAERRAAESQRGQERLDQARAEARAELARQVGGSVLPQAIAEFFDRYWVHHLTVVQLREGPESERAAEARRVLSQLVAEHAEAVAGRVPAAGWLASCREGIDGVLASSGLGGDGAQEQVAALERALAGLASGVPQVEVPVAAEAAPVLEAAVAARQQAEVASSLAIVGGTDTLDFDPADAEALRRMPVGTWLELVGEDGRPQPVKLSWVSPISSRLLFTNRRGVRVLVASPEELAAMKKEGKLVVREGDGAFDQALHQLMDRLKAAPKAGDAG